MCNVLLQVRYPTANLPNAVAQATDICMRMTLAAALLSGMLGCAEDLPRSPPPDAAAELQASPPPCSELACAYTICSSCPVCGHPETTCECFGSDDAGVACTPD